MWDPRWSLQPGKPHCLQTLSCDISTATISSDCCVLCTHAIVDCSATLTAQHGKYSYTLPRYFAWTSSPSTSINKQTEFNSKKKVTETSERCVYYIVTDNSSSPFQFASVLVFWQTNTSIAVKRFFEWLFRHRKREVPDKQRLRWSILCKPQPHH